jgi:hypothetical protein
VLGANREFGSLAVDVLQRYVDKRASLSTFFSATWTSVPARGLCGKRSARS